MHFTMFRAIPPEHAITHFVTVPCCTGTGGHLEWKERCFVFAGQIWLKKFSCVRMHLESHNGTKTEESPNMRHHFGKYTPWRV
ncbi:hypothetical protein GDO81_015386 [Engystomops pustulosus]|uniref:Uncharacterized protein n=1 Tax=Engystomops pustulosus TaxID=76066 RepID=A0AAV7AQ56_ENGPU|nr:hypothetical protein GDO81_015386 [Engystomops pustulosus]